MAIKWPLPERGRKLCRLFYYTSVISALAVVVGVVAFVAVLCSDLAWWFPCLLLLWLVVGIVEAVSNFVCARQIKGGRRPGKVWLFLVFPVRNPFLSLGGWAMGGYVERQLNKREMKEYFRHCEESQREEAEAAGATDGEQEA